jgi:hypothetical protein
MNNAEVVVARADGSVAQWTYRTDAVLPPTSSPPSGLTDVIAVSSSDTHHMALKRDGTVVAWGQNTLGQCDVPTGLAQVIEICAGNGFSLVLKSDGTVAAWGDNSKQQTEVPVRLTNVVSIYAGADQCMVSKGDGSLVCWGQGSYPVPWFINSTVSPGVYQLPTGYSGSVPAIVRPYAVPSITRSPASISTRPGYSVTLEADATGFPTTTVRWQKDGVDVPGATSKKLVLRNITAAELGSYRAVFTSLVGAQQRSRRRPRPRPRVLRDAASGTWQCPAQM